MPEYGDGGSDFDSDHMDTHESSEESMGSGTDFEDAGESSGKTLTYLHANDVRKFLNL